MKIAVYTIALNEEQFVESWYKSAKDADYLLIADTGSVDNTARIAQRLGINVFSISIKPWRFDDARNAALSLIPSDIDYCIALDMDEQLQPGWRYHLEKMDKKITRPRYKYTWSWNEDGSPGLEYGADKIHLRHNYRWKHPVHEIIVPDRIQEKQGWIDLEIHHHPDTSKPRSQYLPLLKLSVEEDPLDDRNSFYYARELFLYDMHKESIAEFKRYLNLPTALWGAERARAYRYLAQMDRENAFDYLDKALQEDPRRRETLVHLAVEYYLVSNWESCNRYAIEALEIKSKQLDYLCEALAWGSLPYDLAAVSSYHLGKIEDAIRYGALAVEAEPSNQRLISNLEIYKQK